MLDRRLLSRIDYLLEASFAVVLLAPRQVGKITLSKENRKAASSVYLDMEGPEDPNKLERPIRYFGDHASALIIVDEIQRVP